MLGLVPPKRDLLAKIAHQNNQTVIGGNQKQIALVVRDIVGFQYSLSTVVGLGTAYSGFVNQNSASNFQAVNGGNKNKECLS